MRNESKHRVFPPLVLFTATHLLHIEQMRWLINAVGIQNPNPQEGSIRFSCSCQHKLDFIKSSLISSHSVQSGLNTD